MKSRLDLSYIFSQLRNTSSAGYQADRCRVHSTPKLILRVDEIFGLSKLARRRSCVWMRHPDLTNVDDWDVEDPLFQVRGVWSKLPLKMNARPRGRRANVMWIWRSKLYVFAGSTNVADSKTAPIFDIW